MLCALTLGWFARPVLGQAPGPALALDVAGSQHVVMLLSPRMTYSLLEFPRMARAAESLGFVVNAYRDPRVPLNEWREGVAAAGQRDLQIIDAMDDQLAARLGLLNHAPSSIVIACGHVHPWVIHGVMPNSAWRQVLSERRADLMNKGCK